MIHMFITATARRMRDALGFLGTLYASGAFMALGILIAITMLSGCGEKEVRPTPLKLVKVFTVGDSVEDRAAASNRSSIETRDSFKDPRALAFDASGRVLSVLIKTGDAVIPGQALVRLDPRDLALSEGSARTQLLAGQAELASAEADFQRYSDLHAKGFISAAEFDRRRAQIEVARARFEALSDQLGYLTLRALESGVVTDVAIKVGGAVNAREVVVRLKLSEPLVTSVGAKLTQGAAATAGLRIPVSAIFEGGFTYRIKRDSESTGTLERVAVKLGAINEQSAEVLAGLSHGDQIVAAGTHVLSSQERVRLK